jgi:hypothetical protein
MTASINTSAPQRGRMVIDITGAATTDNAGLGAIANPEGVAVTILRTELLVLTPSTGAANLSAGVTTVAAAATDILNALAVNGAITGKVYNGNAIQVTAKTEITAPAEWSADKYITFTGSASTAGFTGKLFVEYIRIA